MPNVQDFSLSYIDRLVKAREDLTFDQAYAGMFLVLAATNSEVENFLRQLNPELPTSEALKYKASSFMQLMATKEALSGLTWQEVAGFVAAVLCDVVPLDLTDQPILETCGMGGDRGGMIGFVNHKTINASTLSSFVLAAMGYPVIKHGSYGNTTPVGSTDALDQMGAETTQVSLKEIQRIFWETGYYYADAHNTKTVHDLSHYLGHETINHIVGPMTLPIPSGRPFHKVMGISEKVSPKVIAWAYEYLTHHSMMNLVNGVIVAGLDIAVCPPDYTDSYVREHTVLDELTPGCSVLTFIKEGNYLGQMCVHPCDFGLKLDWSDIWIPSEPDKIRAANQVAFDPDQDTPLRHYLAMNASLGVVLEEDVSRVDEVEQLRERLEERYRQCLECIESGAVRDFVEKYAASTRLGVEDRFVR
jgi:anthranilate phosphoribosyltransferase